MPYSIKIHIFYTIQHASLITSKKTLVIRPTITSGSDEFFMAAFRHSEKRVATELTWEERVDVTLQNKHRTVLTKYEYIYCHKLSLHLTTELRNVWVIQKHMMQYFISAFLANIQYQQWQFHYTRIQKLTSNLTLSNTIWNFNAVKPEFCVSGGLFTK